MEKDVKSAFVFLFSAIVMMATVFVGVFSMLDPFQILHKSYFYPDVYVPKMERFQNAGLAKRLWDQGDCCDILLIGTSHSQNFSPANIQGVFSASQKPSGGVLHMAMSGALPAEQKIIFDFVSQEQKPKQVIWEIHTGYAEENEISLNDPTMLKQSPDKYFPVYLYDTVWWNDFRIFLFIDIVTRFIEQSRKGRTYDSLHSWYEDQKNSFNNGHYICSQNNDLSEKELRWEDPYQFPNIDHVLLPIVRANPDIVFSFFIPPYSLHYYAHMPQSEYERLMAMRRYTLEKLDAYPNAHLFALDGNEFQKDLNQYADMGHYSPEINKKIVQFIAKNSDKLTSKNVDSVVRKFTAQVNRYIAQTAGKCEDPE